MLSEIVLAIASFKLQKAPRSIILAREGCSRGCGGLLPAAGLCAGEGWAGV